MNILKKKKTHLENLEAKIPSLLSHKMLDIGCGRGRFIKEVKERGGDIVGVEINPEKAKIAGAIVGRAENIPFKDQSFDFINMAEVIEHVDDPVKVLKEVKRLLTNNGICYISVPSRYSIHDTHYHLYFINWMPRKIADFILDKTHRSKSVHYDRQRLGEMNYYKLKAFEELCEQVGLKCRETRPLPNFLKWPLKTFHFFLTK